MSEPATITWSTWPVRDERPAKTIVLLAIVGGTVAIATLINLFAGLLAAALLFVLLGPYFLPTRFAVSERGVDKRFPLFSRSRDWDVYRRYAVLPDGVFLGTFPYPSRLDSFRGDFLRFGPGADREAVLELVRRRVPKTRRKTQAGSGEIEQA